MAFPTTSVLDSFNSGASQSLDTPRTGWTTLVFNSGFSFSTDSVPTLAESGAQGGNVWNASSADCEAFVTMTTHTPSLDSHAICARITAVAPDTYYGVRIASGGTNNFQIVKCVSGTVTGIGTLQTQAVANGDGIGISVIGTDVTSFYKSGAGAWTQKDTVSDASITGSGNVAGIRKYGGTDITQIDDFGGGAPVAPASPTPHPLTLVGVGG